MRALKTDLVRLCALIVLSVSAPALAESLEVSASKELIWDQSKGLYQASGDAKARRGTQAISADILTAHYDISSDDQDVERIVAEKNVIFSDGILQGTGANLDYNVAMNFYKLGGPNARISSKDGKARAEDILTFDRANGIIIAKEEAQITLANGRLLQGNSIRIILTETEEIDIVTATGDVYVRQQDGKEAYSQTGVYNATTGKALLTGDVKIIDGESVLNGQRAEIDFNKGISRLIADEASGRVSGILTTSD